MVEISAAENRYMGLMRGLDELSRQPFDAEIIDHDYAPDHDSAFISRRSLSGFKREFDKLYDEIPDSTGNTDFMRRNIESAGTVVDVMCGRLAIGEDLDLPDFVERTMCVRPKMTPEKTLRKQKKQVAEAISNLGFRYEPQERESFDKTFAMSTKQIAGKVVELAEVTRNDLAETAGDQALEGIEAPAIKPVNDPDTWLGYFGTEDKRLFIKMNTNPLLQISELEERVALVHERAHAMSAGTSKLRIATGELSPAAGFLPYFSPAYFQEETIARAAEEYILSRQSGDLARYLYKKTGYENAVRANIILKANDKQNTDDVLEYGVDKLPYDKPEKIEKFVEMVTKKLVYKTVFLVDSQAIRLGREIAAMPDKRRHSVIATLCQGPLGISEFVGAVRLT
jgi:hypothetical protein